MTAVPAEAGGRPTADGNSPPQRAKAFLTAVTWNPIVAKELRSRMRGWHAFALLTGYTCVIGALGWLVYDTDISSSGSAMGLSATGADVFRVLAVAVMATVALIVPGLVGPTISGERERQTLDLLLVTPLRSSTIVVGKLFAALYFVIFLVVACVPLFCVAFLLGGVSLAEVVEAVIFTLLGAFTLGAISMLASVSVRQVAASTVVSYLAVLVLAVGPVAGGYALEQGFQPTCTKRAGAVRRGPSEHGIRRGGRAQPGCGRRFVAGRVGLRRCNAVFRLRDRRPGVDGLRPWRPVLARSRAVRDRADLGSWPRPRRCDRPGGFGSQRVGPRQAEDGVKRGPRSEPREPVYERRDSAGTVSRQLRQPRPGWRSNTRPTDPNTEETALPGELAGVLVPLYRRALGDSAVRWGLLVVAGWASATSLLLAWSKLRPTENVTLIAACLAASAVLAGCAAWARRRPSLLEVARQADARLGLDERLATALCFAGAPGEMGARLRADATGAAQRHRPAEAFPLGRHHKPAIAAGVAALVVIALAVTPNPQAPALAHRAADRAAVAQARKVVAHAQRQLQSLTSPEARQLSAALQRSLSQLEKAGTPIASLVALSDLSRQLAGLDNASAERATGGRGGRRGRPGGCSRSGELGEGPFERRPERSRRRAAGAGERAASAQPGGTQGLGRCPGQSLIRGW